MESMRSIFRLPKICRAIVMLLALPVAAAVGLWASAADTAPFDPLASISAALGSPAQVTAAIEPGAGQGILVVTATLEEGWHLYSLEQKPGGPQPTKITVAADSPLKLAGPFRPVAAPHSRTIKDVPAIAEQIKDFQVTQWYGLLAPAGTPREIVDRLAKETARAVADPKNAAALVKLGADPMTNSPADFRRFIESEIARYTTVVKAAKLTAQ